MILVRSKSPPRVNEDEYSLLSRLDMDARTRLELSEAFDDKRDIDLDGCSVSPDRLPPAWISSRSVRLWLACVIHDVQYERGGSRAERRISDQMLRSHWLRLAWFAKEAREIKGGELRLVRVYAPAAYRVVRWFGGRHWG